MLLWFEDYLLPCAYKSLFGFDCPLCGSQRSLLELLKGNFTESLLLYPPLIPVLSLIGLSILKLLSRELIATKFLKFYGLAVLVIVLGNYISEIVF